MSSDTNSNPIQPTNSGQLVENYNSGVCSPKHFLMHKSAPALGSFRSSFLKNCACAVSDEPRNACSLHLLLLKARSSLQRFYSIVCIQYKISVVLALSLMVIILFTFVIELEPNCPKISRSVAGIIIVAFWWVTQLIPPHVTALLPVVLFPLLGILSSRDVCEVYFNTVIFITMGGQIIGIAMQRWNLHKRLALKILLLLGTTAPHKVLFGFMLVVWFLSWWMSNTATTLTMIPIAQAIVNTMQAHWYDQGASEATNTVTAVSQEQSSGELALQKHKQETFRARFILSVAYASTIGGMTTLVGTTPNLMLTHILSIQFPRAPAITFAGWFRFGFPFSVVFFLGTYSLLCVGISRQSRKTESEHSEQSTELKGCCGRAWNSSPSLAIFFKKLLKTICSCFPHREGKGAPCIIAEEYKSLGPMTYEERIVSVTFAILVTLWVSRVGIGSLPGWSSLLPKPVRSYVDDATVAMFCVIPLFILPRKSRGSFESVTGQAHVQDFSMNIESTTMCNEPQSEDKGKEPLAVTVEVGVQQSGASSSSCNPSSVKTADIPATCKTALTERKSILDWEEIRSDFRVETLLLLGGGFAVATAFVETGLSKWIGLRLQGLAQSPLVIVTVIITAVPTFLTELTSNVATVQILLPIVGQLALQMRQNPLALMLPVCIACECAFMLPVATPPNMVVFGTGLVSFRQMITHGFFVNLLGIFWISAFTLTLFPVLSGISLSLPDWAQEEYNSLYGTNHTVNGTAAPTFTCPKS